MSSRSISKSRYRWTVLAILGCVYVLNFLDRQLLAILSKPIQDDLAISDQQIGLLGGLYFAIFYCILGVPVAWLADRGNRVRVLSVACAIWSAATIACGLAQSYPQLALARMSVGIGEAGGVPPSYSIISDYFAPQERGAAFGLFNLGPPLGQALGVALGARIAAAYDWRMAFIVLGGAGLVAAAIVWGFVKEPTRGSADHRPILAEPGAPMPGFWQTARSFVSRPVLLFAALAAGATQFVTYATAAFTTLFLMREKGMTLDQVATWYALLVFVGVGGGIYASGRLLDRFSADRPDIYATMPALTLALAVPPFIGFVAAPSWQLAMVFLAAPTFLNYFYLTPAVALVQHTVEPRQRTVSGAVLLLIMNLIGLGLGPTWIGVCSELLRPHYPENSLQLAFCTLVPFYLIAIMLHLKTARVIRSAALLRS